MIALVSLLVGENRFVTIYIQDKPFLAEIADTPEKHSKGLMFRQKIKDDYGMLFIFPEEDIRSFWMKNTLIVLDIIYLNQEQQIVDMFVAVPLAAAIPALHTPRSYRPSMFWKSMAVWRKN